jgi:hypothetical protein
MVNRRKQVLSIHHLPFTAFAFYAASQQNKRIIKEGLEEDFRVVSASAVSKVVEGCEPRMKVL